MTSRIDKLRSNDKNSDGFSLVELMIVVAIIGVLASIAIPKFETFQARAKTAEALKNLRYIYALQETYKANTSTYAPLPSTGWSAPFTCTNTPNLLGFSLQPCDRKVRYRYETLAGMTSTTYTLQATSGANTIMKNCAILDTWTYTQDRVQVHTVDPIALCL